MTGDDDELLADLLPLWQEIFESGRDVPAAELCREAPHLTDELARRIEAVKAMAWLDDSGEATALVDDRPRPSGCGKCVLADRYRLDELIAEGGFAQVWRGYDLELQRTVAIKMPKSGWSGSVELFLAEARRVAQLAHQGIVPIFDTAGCSRRIDSKPAACFLVSKYVIGGSLADRISAGPLPIADALRYLAEVAEALDYAHRQGIVHRDIKPGNILLEWDADNGRQRAMLTDFGIAVVADEALASVAGTLRYMSPEQLEGKSLDARSDIYSLGVVLHELLTGKLPYSSSDPVPLRQEILSGATIACLPATLRKICHRTLQRQPEARYPSAAQMAADLRRYSSGAGFLSSWKLFARR